MKVAFFGGSFDPPHPTHRRVALAAQRLLGLDEVWFAPAGRQPLKQHEPPPASFDDRVAMLRLALAGHAGLTVSLADAPRAEPNYSVDTLARLRPTLPPGAQLFFLGGADTFLSLPHWRSPAALLRMGELLDGWILAARPGFPLQQLADALPYGFTLGSPLPAPFEPSQATAAPASQTVRLHTIEVCTSGLPPMPLHLLTGMEDPTAATTIRTQIAEGRDDVPLDPDVLAYIRAHGLYSGGSRMLR
jgi:nicotinate-nucleotide adenylyltransferase